MEPKKAFQRQNKCAHLVCRPRIKLRDHQSARHIWQGLYRLGGEWAERFSATTKLRLVIPFVVLKTSIETS